MMKRQILFIIFSVFSLQLCYPKAGALDFRDITMEDGLPSNLVNCITQDTVGFMWFGTAFGLCRYDGNDFKIYHHDPKDPDGLTWNTISSILTDSQGTLWVGTGGRGLNRFDQEQEKFIAYRYDENDSTSLSNEDYIHVYEDRQGRLWVGTMYGLNRYDAQNDRFVRYTHDSNDPSSISSKYINYIFEDSKSRFWVSTNGDGLELFDRETGKVVHHFKHNPEDTLSIRDNFIVSIFEDDEHDLWVGTDQGFDRLVYYDGRALFKHVGNTKDLSPYISRKKVIDLYKRKGSHTLIHSGLRADFEDNEGNIWIGTLHDGVKFYNPLRDDFITYKYRFGDPDGLNNRSVLAVCEQSGGNLWIGVDEGGLHYYDREKDSFKYVPLDPQKPADPSNENITVIEEDSRGDIWVGTWGKGITRFEKKSGKSIHYIPEENNPSSLNCPIVRSIIEDSRQNIWIGTYGGGMSLYDRNTDGFIPVPEISQADTFSQYFELSKMIYQIYEDNHDNLWIGAGSGLFLFNRDTRAVRTWKHHPDDSTTISGLHVQILSEDSRGNFWVGTWYGLNHFNPDDNTFTRYTVKDGLPSNSISGIMEDDHGILWIGTGNGISKFNWVDHTFKNYDVHDGLQGDYFNQNACIRLKSGEFFFGGENGFTIFHPDRVHDIRHVPPVVITDFQIFNKPVKPGDEHSPLQKSIHLTDEIVMPYWQHSISLEFAVLDYINPKRNMYKYKLEGFHKDWVETTADHRVAAFTNLRPGKYVFRVIGANSKGVWNTQGASVKIVITPPWWKTAWAYLFYIFLTGAVVWLTWKAQLRRVHLRQELRMKQFQADQLRELDQLKSRFFANMSHEIRTPLTLILGPLQQLVSEISKPNWKTQLHIMARNSRQLLRLINQFLDFSKLEAGRMTLQAREVKLVPLLKGMVHSFDSMAKQKQITLTFNSENDEIHAFIDPDKLEKIMANLLSNAFKFTPEGGKISADVSIRRGPLPSAPTDIDHVQITVADTGIGIAPGHLDHIFERYYQADEKKEQTGSGIGLALTRELVELHHGTIAAESEPGKGTRFVLCFPLGKDHLKAGELVSEEMEPVVEPDRDVPEPSINGRGTLPRAPSRKDLPVILIVEDTEDVRTYIRGFLEPDYQIAEAQDGEDGFEKAAETIPDLIVSDVMMPKMNGFLLCEKLKTDERTSHIPVILLTARAAESSKLQGLETGADDYLVKPFQAKELKVRIKNLIEQRRRLRERFTRDVTLSPKDISVTSADERFLVHAIQAIENHMADPDFGVDVLGKEVGMSHSQLHRKIRALTNQSPVELIRTFRLKRAAGLLKQKFGNVAEIAYEVGFNNPAYFAECFRKLFGRSPSDYMKSE
jgi:signal transduction histidine kinase/ligand-binding sensor domain-containing protein/DNA-binding response OmpR family regulator